MPITLPTSPLALTPNTLMVDGLFPAPGAVTTIVPLYVVPGASWVPSTLTLREPPVVPLAGVTESQATEPLLFATTV